ncbi:hypothetical protein FRB94_000927 [Tulasnella sp. JGI-2019a]|nr:hypothetical protein FRB93_012272 [Tulasnella sp. JGI-2019a]KAG8988284.1 hypothetical protein FRB94_000927 [Tulasnella sp. JGI-2019a]
MSTFHGHTPTDATDPTLADSTLSGIIQPDEIVIDPRIVASSSLTSRALWRNSPIAVKRLPQDASRQGVADLVRQLQVVRHARIQRLLGASHFPSGPSFLVTPYCENGNVMQYLATHPEILPRNLAYEAAVGMEYLYMMNVIHGRLRPQNILISNDGQACIGDPGLYHFSTTPASASYLSPQAWKGKVSKPSDVFAFSMVVYEMYTMGRPPGSDAPYQLAESEWSTIERSWNSDANARPTSSEIVRWMSQPDLAMSTSPASTQSTDPPSLNAPNLYRSVFSLEEVHAPSMSPAPPAYNLSTIDPGQRRHPSGVNRPSPILTHPAQSSSRISRSLPWSGQQPLSSYPEERVHSPSTSGTPQLRDIPRHHTLDSRAYQHSRRVSSAPSSSSSPSSSQTDPSRFSFTPGSPLSWVTSPGIFDACSPREFIAHSRTGSTDYPKRLTYVPERWLDSPPTSSPIDVFSSSEPTNVSAANSSSRSPVPTAHTESTTSLAPDGRSLPSVLTERNDGRWQPSTVSSTRHSAVIVAGALLSEIIDGRKREVIDRYLRFTQQLISQSEEEAQRFITAGIVPTLILLVKARAVDGVGIEIALKTLGMLAHDSLSSNTIFRTNTASILLEIVDNSDNEDAIALSLWCLSRISRGSEVAAGLVRKDIVSVLLRKGISRSPSTAQIASWCLGNLVYTDAMAETLVAQGAAPIMVDHLRKTLSSPSSQPDDPE